MDSLLSPLLHVSEHFEGDRDSESTHLVATQVAEIGFWCEFRFVKKREGRLRAHLLGGPRGQ